MDSIAPQTPDSEQGEHDDWSDAPHEVQNVRFDIRGRAHYSVRVTTDSHRVEIAISPQGRSVRVFLDGIPMQEEPPELARKVGR